MAEFFDEELLRTLLLRVLKKDPDLHRSSLNQVVSAVAKLAEQEELFPNLTESYYEHANLNPTDEFTLTRLIRELIFQGVLAEGFDSNNAKWPWMSVTPHGRKVLGEEGPTPYEPNEYLREALETANSINPEIMLYLNEAIQAFRRGLYLSSAVMLGVASEAALEGLSDVLCKGNEGRTSKIQKAYTLKKKHEIVMGWVLNGGVLEDNAGLKEKVETYLGDLFQANRLTRNESGHPTGKEIKRDAAYGFLYLFPSYLQTIKELMGFLESMIADPT